MRRVKVIPLALTCLAVCFGPSACNRSPQAKEAKFLKRAEAFLAQKDYPRAMLELKNASGVMPKDAEPYYRLGLVELEMGASPRAVAYLRRAIELNPNHSQAKLKLGQVMSRSGVQTAVEDAARTLGELVSNAPENLEAVDALAFTEWRLGRQGDAIKRLEEALARVPSHLESSVTLARVRLSSKDYDGAERALKEAVEAAPQSAAAAFVLAQFYVAVRKLDSAEREARRAAKLDPKNGPALLLLGGLQLNGSRVNEAEQTYKLLSALPEPQYKPVHALFLMNAGKPEAAVAELEQLAKQAPDDRAARSRLVAAYVVTNQAHRGEQILKDALKRNPKDVDALTQRAHVYMSGGKMAQAEADLREALHFRPDSVEAHYAMATLSRLMGRTTFERQELNEVLRLSPSSLSPRIALARSFILSNEAKSALAVLDQIPGGQKQATRALIERNWALFALGNLQELRTSLPEALARERAPELVLQSGLLKMIEKNPAGARLDAEEFLTQSPEDSRGARLLAQTYDAQNQGGNALERLRQLASEHPKSAELQQIYGQWLAKAGNPTAAKAAFQAAKTANPGYTNADLALAEMELGARNLDSARQILHGVVQKEPGNIVALQMLAASDVASQQRDAAIAGYRNIIERSPRDPIALNNLAYMLAIDQPDEALKYAQQALEASPDSAAVQDTIAWVYYRKGIYDTAVNYLRTAVAREPTPRRQFHLGMSYIRRGDRGEGQRLCAEALRQDPSLVKTEQGW